MVNKNEITNRKFGIEIEYVGVSRDELAQALMNVGIDASAETYNHRTQRYWKVITDASCGYEIVSPILQGEEGISELEKVCEVMNEVGCSVNRHTGVHVHLDAADLTFLDAKHIVKRYHENETKIDSWFPRSRRSNNNTYCGSVASNFNLDRLDMVEGENPVRNIVNYQRGRFTKVNTQSLRTHGTIEFRQHSGSTDFTKIGNWVLFLQHFVEQCRKYKGMGNVTVDTNYKPRRKMPFGEIREQVLRAGGRLVYGGGKKIRGGNLWVLTNMDGTRFEFSNIELDALYVDNGDETEVRNHRTHRGYRPLKTEITDWFTTHFPSSDEVLDGDLMGGIPTEVADFFETRSTELGA
jgi:hypothetical protein